MEVRVVILLCFCVVLGNCYPRKVKSKPENIEDTYGDLVDSETDDNVQNDDFDYPEGEAPPDENNESVRTDDVKPEFITKPQEYIAKLGDRIRLPCEVSDSDVVVIWKKEAELLYQGHLVFGDHPNLIEYNNNTLDVNITSANDYGSYACILMITNEDKSRPQIVHRIVAPRPPKIVSLYAANNKTVYKVGETLTLTCLATGDPKPEITWHKGSERLAIKGETLTVTDMQVENAGIYRCLADNKLQPLGHHHTEIFVEHAPELSIAKFIVNSDNEKEAELMCTVHAYPPAVVVWKKNGKNIVSKPPFTITTKKHQNSIESILVISNLTDNHFGRYNCSAKNSLGKKERGVDLVKTPAVREFIKPDKSTNKDVVLTWKVESRTPISQHELQFRRQGDQEWQNRKPEVTNEDNNIYTVKYTLTGLEAGSYETRVRSKNMHGWSQYSDIVPFEGVSAKHGSTHKNHHKKHHKEKETKEKHVSTAPEAIPAQHQENSLRETPVGASKPSGSNQLTSSVSIISIALLFLYFNIQ